MPTNQPSNADPIGPDAKDDATPAAVLTDDTPGGRLGGAAAADPLGGSDGAPRGTGPNPPVDPGVSAAQDLPGGPAEREAQRRSLHDGPTEPNPVSR